MHANFLNTHVIVSELADASGSLQVSAYDNADAANNLFEHRVQLPQGAGDNDGDGDQTDTRYRWVAWYGKGRLIKYRKLDQ
jgi:hypothetical protein